MNQCRQTVWRGATCVPCFKDVKNLNIFAFFVHAAFVAASIVILILQKGHERCVPLTQTYNVGRPGFLELVNATVSNTTYKALTGTETLAGPGICYGYLVLGFEVVCAIAHFCIWFFASEYQNILNKQVNWMRWLEYSISASLMLISVLAACGVSNFSAVFASVFCNVGMIACGYWNESNMAHLRLINAVYKKAILPSTSSSANLRGGDQDALLEKKGAVLPPDVHKPWKWLPFAVGSVLGGAPWVGIFYAFAAGVARASPPWIVVVVVVQLFVFFNCFAVVEILWTGGWITKYDTKERSYILLSLYAKTMLSAIILAGMF